MGKNKKKQKAAKENKAKLSRSYEKFERTVKRSLNLMSLQLSVQKAFPTVGGDKVDPADLPDFAEIGYAG